jgi:hypothetical protein
VIFGTLTIQIAKSKVIHFVGAGASASGKVRGILAWACSTCWMNGVSDSP